MKLYERFADKSYHTSVATTFAIDFDAYETIVLPRLRGAGCRNNMVLADSRMLGYALGGASALPQHAGKLYGIEGKNSLGAFHPKIFLQIGRTGGRLIVGSANITAAGLAGNLELVEAIVCDDKDSSEQRLIASAWNFVSSLVQPDQKGLAAQRDWMLARAPWLRRATPAPGVVELQNQTQAAFLTTGGKIGIGHLFADLIDGPVSRLVVLSPYWDLKLEALSYLIKRLQAQETGILIDPETMVFPKDAVGALPSIKLYSWGDRNEGRFVHAKAIVAQTKSADHVLIGSANCTVAALGTAGFAGHNDEACLYRRFPPGSFLEALGLHNALNDGTIISVESLKAGAIDDDSIIDETVRVLPGKFECRADVLSWHPPAAVNPANSVIELLDERGDLIVCQLSPISDGMIRRYQLSGAEKSPSFAKLRFIDGSSSELAIVTLADRLGAAIRETQSRDIEKASFQLEAETEASLLLLEVLDVLEKVESDDDIERKAISIPKTRSGDDDHTGQLQFAKLTYEQFISGRRPRLEKSVYVHSSIAGANVSIVRVFLNRVLGLNGAPGDQENEQVPEGAFDLQDEKDLSERDVGQTEETLDPEDVLPKGEAANIAREQSAKIRYTQQQIVSAVAAYGQRIRGRRSNGALSNQDMLRLRALLMIIAAVSWSPSADHEKDRKSPLRILPAEGRGETWPFVIGRLLFGIFGGTDPAIRYLYLQQEHDQISDDILECWASCYWFFQACLTAPVEKLSHDRIRRYLRPLAMLSYRITLPSRAELLGDDILSIMDAMSRRYGAQLGLTVKKIMDGHHELVNELFGKANELGSPRH
ncbi:MAG: hypothetical protein SFV19_00675 [Rhodospirillaceae bacterium]|nr:hypothetical protein [Rhodospirillaceae bacterium]